MRRSALYVPANSDRFMANSLASEADTLIFDLQESVPADDREKEAAREGLAEFVRLNRAHFAGRLTELTARINVVGSPWFAADVQMAVAAGLDGIVIPMSHSPLEVAAVARIVDGCRRPAAGAPPRLLPLIESIRGVANVEAILACGDLIDGLLFGKEDIYIELGLPLDYSLAGLQGDIGGLHCRSRLVLAAALRGLAVLDSPSLPLRALDAVRADMNYARRLGFAGKQCVHPTQVALANEIFAPDDAAVAEAERIVGIFHEGFAAGQTMFVVDGRMIDLPCVAHYERLLVKRTEVQRLETARRVDLSP